MYSSPEGERLLITDRAKTASVWNARTGEKLCELPGLRRDIRDAKWSPDGKTIMLTTQDDSSKAHWLDMTLVSMVHAQGERHIRRRIQSRYERFRRLHRRKLELGCYAFDLRLVLVFEGSSFRTSATSAHHPTGRHPASDLVERITRVADKRRSMIALLWDQLIHRAFVNDDRAFGRGEARQKGLQARALAE